MSLRGTARRSALPSPADRECQKPSRPERFLGGALLRKTEQVPSLQVQSHHPKSLWAMAQAGLVDNKIINYTN